MQSESSIPAGFVILSALAEGDMEWIFGTGRERKVAAGEVVVNEGVRGEFLYIVLDGLVAVLSSGEGGREIARLGPGETFGEMSFLDNRPASATVAAIEDSSLLAIARADFEDDLPKDPGLAARLYKGLAMIVAGRLRQSMSARALWTGDGHQPPAPAAVMRRWTEIADRTQQFKEGLAKVERGEPGAPDAAALNASLADFSRFLTNSIGPKSRESFAVRDELGSRVMRELLPYVLGARTMERLHTKPRGYACDQTALQMLLDKTPGGTSPAGQLLDAAFHELPAIRGIRKRKATVTAEIVRYAAERNSPIQVAGIGAGASDPLFDALRAMPNSQSLRATIVDVDPHGLAAVSARAASEGLGRQIQLLKTSVLRLASGHQEFDMKEQDIIYSVTVADFLDDRLLIRVLNDVYEKLRPGGEFLLSSFRSDNPDRALLDYVTDWKISHRGEDELRALFKHSRFNRDKLRFVEDPEGPVILAIASKFDPAASGYQHPWAR